MAYTVISWQFGFIPPITQKPGRLLAGSTKEIGKDGQSFPMQIYLNILLYFKIKSYKCELHFRRVGVNVVFQLSGSSFGNFYQPGIIQR